MPSCIGHALTGTVIALYERRPIPWLWLSWLIFLVGFPDIEYLALWFFGVNFPIRYSHSLVVCTFLPLFTTLWLWRRPMRERGFRVAQTFAAGWSHPVLDLLTGVSTLPLFWPLSDTSFRLPFGILPSAGRLYWDNVYLYRNLGIELGILAPLYSLIVFGGAIRRHPLRHWIICGHLAILLPCLIAGITLYR